MPIKKIQKIKLKNSSFVWYDLNTLGEEEIAFLKKNFKFHHLDLEDLMGETQRPKIDEYNDYMFIIINVPIKKNKIIKKSQIYFFISDKFIISIHEKNNILDKIVKKVQKSEKSRKDYIENGVGYLFYMILDDLFESNFPLIDEMEKQITYLEEEVFTTSKGYDRLKEILTLKKDIINFRRIIMPERSIVAVLNHKFEKFINKDLELYFDDVVDKVEKIWNHLENLYELVETVHETNDALISHDTNHIIKILTIVSVILMPLTFITGFYGMNVNGLPFSENVFATIIVSLILFLVATSMFIYFRYKKWI